MVVIAGGALYRRSPGKPVARRPHQPVRNLLFRHFRPALHARPRNHMHGVPVAPKDPAFRNVVGDNPVTPFAFQLLDGVPNDIAGFGREADHQTGPVGGRFAIVRKMSGFSTS